MHTTLNFEKILHFYMTFLRYLLWKTIFYNSSGFDIILRKIAKNVFKIINLLLL